MIQSSMGDMLTATVSLGPTTTAPSRTRPPSQVIAPQSFLDAMNYNVNTPDFIKKLHGDYSMNKPSAPFIANSTPSATDIVATKAASIVKTAQAHASSNPIIFGGLALVILGGLAYWKLHK